MYKCTKCGYTSSKWMGKCPKCNSWGTFEEVIEIDDNISLVRKNLSKNKVASTKYETLNIITGDVSIKKKNKTSTGFAELDRALAGGIFEGSVHLIGGEPGIGKSTLLMQVLVNLSLKGKNVLYVSAEESLSQITERLKRITHKIPQNFFLASDVNLTKILQTLKEEKDKYDYIVFDSIQAFLLPELSGNIGGISQVKAVVSLITNFAKLYNKSVFLVGQVTKEGTVSGPKAVEHIVDVVLYMEYLGVGQLRIVRTIKNRFGEVGEVGFLEMTAKGFIDRADAENLFLDNVNSENPGASFGVTIQGSRALVVQIQSLLVDSIFVSPKRVVEGVSRNKVELLSAVITRKINGIYLNKKDLYLKVIGGISLKDSGVDLALVASIVSAYKDVSFKNSIFIGEVGLLGDIKPCLALDLRIKEAKKLGFKNIYTYKNLKYIWQILDLL